MGVIEILVYSPPQHFMDSDQTSPVQPELPGVKTLLEMRCDFLSLATLGHIYPLQRLHFSLNIINPTSSTDVPSGQGIRNSTSMDETELVFLWGLFRLLLRATTMNQMSLLEQQLPGCRCRCDWCSHTC